MMHILPFETRPGVYDVFIVLEEKNLERMKAHDPAQVAFGKFPPNWHSKKLERVIICYADPLDIERVIKLMRGGHVLEGMQYLTRGFKFDPKAGDSDRPYTSLKGT